MSFPKYPAYKDSGVPWIGDIPAAWEVKSFKWLLNNNDGGVWGDDPTGEEDTVVLRSTDQTVDGNWRFVDPALRNLSAKEKASALLVEGDLVVTKSSGSSLHIGKTTLVTADIATQGCCYGNFMQRLRVNSSFIPRLAWYVMNNELARSQLDLLSNSTTGLANLNAALIGEILLPVATVAEQTQIARFLDHETARIDALIEEQQRLIELLKEKRQAVISHAVTKGLDPTVPMKDSGVEWLGEVPAHWDVKALRRVLKESLSNGIFKKKEDFGSGVLLVNVFDVYRQNFQVNYSSLDRVDCNAAEISSYSVLPGDLFFVRSSLKYEGIAVVAVAGECSEPVVYECHLICARPDSAVFNGRYGSYLFNSSNYRATMISKSKLTTMTTIDQEAISSTLIPTPPLSEQAEISVFLDREINKADQLIGEADSVCELLKDRRSALSPAAVPGKIDVRGWQPPASTQAPASEVVEAQ